LCHGERDEQDIDFPRSFLRSREPPPRILAFLARPGRARRRWGSLRAREFARGRRAALCWCSRRRLSMMLWQIFVVSTRVALELASAEAPPSAARTAGPCKKCKNPRRRL